MGSGDCWAFGFERAWENAFERFWDPAENLAVRAVSGAPVGRAFDRRSFQSDAAYMRDPMVRAVMLPHGLMADSFAVLQRDRDTISGFWIARRQHADLSEGATLHALSPLIPHFCQAMRTHRALGRGAAAARLAAALDRLAHGVLLLDGGLSVLHANSAADAMLVAGDGLRLRHGRLRLSDPDAGSALRDAARRLSHAVPDMSEARLQARRPSRALPYALRVLPALGDATSGCAPRARLMVLIDDPDKRWRRWHRSASAPISVSRSARRGSPRWPPGAEGRRHRRPARAVGQHRQEPPEGGLRQARGRRASQVHPPRDGPRPALNRAGSPEGVRTGRGPWCRIASGCRSISGGGSHVGPFQFLFVACLAGTPAPTDCERVRGPVFAPGVSRAQCMLEGPAITAAWSARNPGREVRSWHCRGAAEAGA